MIRYVDYDIVFQEIPDEITLAINLSCCPNRCKGCHTPSLMEEIGEGLTENVLSGLLLKYNSSITCVCFMGGDNSPQEIERLAQFVHKYGNLKTGWYSGRDIFPLEMESFDYVKLGRYMEVLGGLRHKTTNQRLYRRKMSNQWEDITSKFWK